MTYWDPIGVNGVPEAYDEYDEYSGQLARKLREGADARAVAEYLADVQTERMCLPKTAAQLTEVADHVSHWYSVEMQH
jgi:hypothetical protein